jgi:hypothetical protein
MLEQGIERNDATQYLLIYALQDVDNWLGLSPFSWDDGNGISATFHWVKAIIFYYEMHQKGNCADCCTYNAFARAKCTMQFSTRKIVVLGA